VHADRVDKLRGTDRLGPLTPKPEPDGDIDIEEPEDPPG